MNDITDYDDDFELSNKVVNEYLNQFEEFNDFKDESEKPFEFNHDKKENQENDTKKSISKNEPFNILYLIDPYKLPKILSRNFQTTNQVILKEDIKQILDFDLKIYSFYTNKFKILKYLISDITWIVILVLLILFLFFFTSKLSFLGFLYYYFLVTFGFVLFFLFELKLFDYVVVKLLTSIYNKMTTFKNLVKYLKEIELVSLSNRRQYSIENKRSIDQIQNDQLNYPYRKLCFEILKNEFSNLKLTNTSILENLKPNIDRSGLICTMSQDELSEILCGSLDSKEIEKLTDFYSINFIRSMHKLNHILLSEQIKLFFYVYLNLAMRSMNMLNISFHWFKIYLKLYKSINFIIQTQNDLESLRDICRLVGEFDIKDEKSSMFLRNRQEFELANILRNAQLNLYEMAKLDDKMKDEKLEYFKMLKINMDHFEIFFKQLEIKIEGNKTKKIDNGLNDDNKFNDLTKDHKPKNENGLLNQEIKSEVVLDEIYEADTFNEEEKEKTFMQTNGDIEEKKSNLVNKNLMYELKYALKSKKNEWKIREKNAKRTIDENSKTIFEEYKNLKKEINQEEEEDGYENDYLLDNEALIYKSKLKKRRNLCKIQDKEFKCQKKYAFCNDNNEKDFIKEDLITKSNSFLSEIINKRNDFLKKNKCSDDEEEIIT